MNVQPIHLLKDVRAIKRLITNSARDGGIFAIGINFLFLLSCKSN